jgi:hypothetical protein
MKKGSIFRDRTILVPARYAVSFHSAFDACGAVGCGRVPLANPPLAGRWGKWSRALPRIVLFGILVCSGCSSLAPVEPASLSGEPLALVLEKAPPPQLPCHQPEKRSNPMGDRYYCTGTGRNLYCIPECISRRL